jgi:hypothetical protein
VGGGRSRIPSYVAQAGKEPLEIRRVALVSNRHRTAALGTARPPMSKDAANRLVEQANEELVMANRLQLETNC